MEFSSYGDQSQSSGMSSEFQPSQEVRDRKRAALDNFLALCDHSPVKSTLSSNWEDSSSRSRQSYLCKLEQVIESAASVLAPDEPEQLQSAYFQANQLAIIPEAKGQQLLEALAQSYNSVNSWDSRRQILSVMADTYTLVEIQVFLPTLTRYRFRAARHHISEFGHGAPVPKQRVVRTRISQLQVEHFVSFITSPHVMLDLPFGETVLKLSNGSCVQVPKVITTMIPERLISQYGQFCEESDFTPTGNRSLRRILDACSTTYR